MAASWLRTLAAAARVVAGAAIALSGATASFGTMVHIRDTAPLAQVTIPPGGSWSMRDGRYWYTYINTGPAPIVETYRTNSWARALAEVGVAVPGTLLGVGLGAGVACLPLRRRSGNPPAL